MPCPPDDLDALLQRGYRYALSLTHDAAQAEDLLQDACASIARRGGPWHAGYIQRCIRHRWIDHHRRSRRVGFTALHGSESAPTESASDDHDDLHRALATLRDADRELLFLHVVEGRTAQEIADLTERPRGTILSAIFRAKRRLRDALTPDDRAPDPSSDSGVLTP